MLHKFPILCGVILLDKEIAKGFSGVTYNWNLQQTDEPVRDRRTCQSPFSLLVFSWAKRTSRQCSFSMLLIGLARQKLVCANRQSSKSLPAEGSLASPDAFPGIATWRSQPCVRRCSFGALRLISAVTGFSLVFSWAKRIL